MAVEKYKTEIEMFGKKIRILRDRKGLSQKALAEEAGVDLRTIQRIEYGEIAPGLVIILDLAKVFGILPYKLLKGIELGGE